MIPGREDGGLTGYVAIQSFGTNTAHDTSVAIAALQAEGASAFILDLRGNSGGLVNAGALFHLLGSFVFPSEVNMACQTQCLHGEEHSSD